MEGCEGGRTSKEVNYSPQSLGSTDPILCDLADKGEGDHAMVSVWMQVIAEGSLRYLGIWDRR